ncbi:hypothetical protein FS749_004821 [Ceratobasidium sp. UAMH 11750]|nr:hypothetical protein FS749_004821 [Ceratobasidium sp. UAMH 11750]
MAQNPSQTLRADHADEHCSGSANVHQLMVRVAAPSGVLVALFNGEDTSAGLVFARIKVITLNRPAQAVPGQPMTCQYFQVRIERAAFRDLLALYGTAMLTMVPKSISRPLQAFQAEWVAHQAEVESMAAKSRLLVYLKRQLFFRLVHVVIEEHGFPPLLYLTINDGI